ncbi:hypothetical protein, partial [Paraburkholderia tropica]|uniref:hypothetical protein n=1 Tax=Paraburkholderia tropica TaxID=92647 RepID=UPI002E18E863
TSKRWTEAEQLPRRLTGDPDAESPVRRRSTSARKNVASTLASHRHKRHAATVDAASMAPDCLAERRQFAATVLRVRFGSGYRHVAASLLLRCLPLSRACGHCVIV